MMSPTMSAVALAAHIFAAVTWVGGMFVIYVCLRPALATLEMPQRFRSTSHGRPSISGLKSSIFCPVSLVGSVRAKPCG